MHHITVQYAADKKLAPAKKLICRWAAQALTSIDHSTEVTIRIVDLAEMTTLNETYRHKKGPTNVLSFRADLPMGDDEVELLGDMIICAEVVNREAHEQKKSVEAHWAHIVVHGIFHLLGYDHVKEDEAIKMEALEINILLKLGFANPYNDGEMLKHHE